MSNRYYGKDSLIEDDVCPPTIKIIKRTRFFFWAIVIFIRLFIDDVIIAIMWPFRKS